MKTLTIGEITLELKDFAKRWDRIAGVYAIITIPTTAISSDELEALFTDNQNDLIVTHEDGTTETFKGYSELHSIEKNIPNGLFVVTQYCTSTAMHLLNEARKQIDTLESKNTELQGVVTAQNMELFAQAEVIVAQGETIAVQNEQVATLMEASISQLDAIDSIMTEVLPLVAQEAANMAVEQALAAIAKDEEQDDSEYYSNLEQEAYEEMIASETITEED